MHLELHISLTAPGEYLYACTRQPHMTFVPRATLVANVMLL